MRISPSGEQLRYLAEIGVDLAGGSAPVPPPPGRGRPGPGAAPAAGPRAAPSGGGRAHPSTSARRMPMHWIVALALAALAAGSVLVLAVT